MKTDINMNCLRSIIRPTERNAHSHDVMQKLGLKPGGHLPVEGMAPRIIDGIKVWVAPAPSDKRTPLGKLMHRSTHRVMAECPHCKRTMSAGRLHQHKCSTTA